MALTPEQLAAASRAIQGGYSASPNGMTYAPPSASYPSSSNYGGAKFGGGGGGPNRYDYTQWGGGLYSIGIDPAKSGYYNDVQKWYDSQPANVRTEVDSYWKNNKRTGNASFDLANAVDWRQRDVARKIQKEHGAFDFLGPLAPIGGALATAAGSVLGGPIGGALAGGLAGGLGSKSVLGGLLGAAGGYMGGGLLDKIGIPTNMLGVPGGGTLGGLYNSVTGSALNNVNQYMPADIAARAAQGASYGGLAPIVDHSVQVATHTPPGIFATTKDLLSNAVNPSNIAGGIVKGIANNAIGSLLGGPSTEPQTGGGMMGGAPSNAFGINPYAKSPYPELFFRPRSTISNQLVV